MTTIFSYDQTKTHSSEHRDSKGTLPAFLILAILAGLSTAAPGSPIDRGYGRCPGLRSCPPVAGAVRACGAVVTAGWGFSVAGILERDVLQCNLSDRSFDLLEWQ